MLRFLMSLTLLLAAAAGAAADEIPATLYKQPYCGCCDGHADHLRASGFKVTVVETDQLSRIKAKHGIPAHLEGCHTIEVGRYVVEGHVPADIIHKLLRQRPPIQGISLPGMPDGSPGMSGVKHEPFVVYEVGPAQGRVFATE